jgi:hypothetical protein
LARRLFDLAHTAQTQGWSAEFLLRQEALRRESAWRKREPAHPRPGSKRPKTSPSIPHPSPS